MFSLFETIVLGILGIALMLTIIRLLKGPTVPDRILALDVLSMIAIGILGLYAVATEDPAPLDVAIGIALVAFLATAGLAHYYLTHHEAPSESQEASVEKRPNRGKSPRDSGTNRQ